jgi:hypothetical protein
MPLVRPIIDSVPLPRSPVLYLFIYLFIFPLPLLDVTDGLRGKLVLRSITSAKSELRRIDVLLVSDCDCSRDVDGNWRELLLFIYLYL